jgi:hypothetical protein
MHYGEERIYLDEEIYPELLDGLITAMNWLRYWYYPPDHKVVQIEAKKRSGLFTPRRSERAAFFFSGGIDSFATLRANRLYFAPEHPGSIKDGLLVYGLELDDLEVFDYVVDSLSNAAKEIGISLIPVYTNIYLPYRPEDKTTGFKFWIDEFIGAALAAIAHAFARRFNVISLSSTFDIPNLHPHGSHPNLDPNYSSSDLRIRHEGITLSRLEKTKLIADWDVPLRHLRVCNLFSRYQPDQLNCGRCEKCVRTMLAFLSLGILDRVTAFPTQEISEELLQSALVMNKTTYPYYGELIAPLKEKGRFDLVRVIERKMVEYHRREKMLSWNLKLRWLDRQYLSGNLVRFKRLLSS